MGAAVLPVMAAGALIQGRATQVNDQYQAGIANQNQAIAYQNAEYAQKQGAVEEANSWMKTNQTFGAAKAAQGAAGIDVNTGTASRVQSDIQKIGAMDALTIRNNAARKAYGYTVQGLQFGAQRDSLKQAGGMAMLGGVISAAALGGKAGLFDSIMGGAEPVTPGIYGRM